MRNLKFVKTILFLLSVLVLHAPASVLAAPVPSGFLSGESTLETLSLEEDYAVLLSSPEHETAKDQVAIRAINPGYTTSAGKNSGELIELINLSDEEVDLSNLAIIYTAKPSSALLPGKSTVLYVFPPGSRFVGDSILLRYELSPEVTENTQDLTYSTSLAMAGSLALVQLSPDVDLSSIPANSPLSAYGEVLNSVCWLGGEDCLPVFSTTVKSRSYTTIIRNEETEEYEHVSSYTPLFDPNSPGLFLPPEDSEPSADGTSSSKDAEVSTPSGGITTFSVSPENSPCRGLEFSEIFTYYEDSSSEQFIEIYNSSKSPIDLEQCNLRYKKKFYPLSDSSKFLAPKSLFVFSPLISLTKNPTTENLYEIVDAYGNIIDALSLPHGQKKSASYALMTHNSDGTKSWQITYSKTPGEPNIYQEFRTCPAGKIINESTGNCVNASTLKSTLKDCGAGKYRNPETGRCKNIDDSSSEQKPCKDGYERNPETGRCRKIKNNNGADFPVVPVTDIEDSTSLIAIYTLIALGALGALYILFQFRKELLSLFHKLAQKLKK